MTASRKRPLGRPTRPNDPRPKVRKKSRPKSFITPLNIGILVAVVAVLAGTTTYLLLGSGEPKPLFSKELAARGEPLYNQHCSSCHGQDAVGENPADIYAQDEQGLFAAPPLNGTAHSWHHTDEDLVKSILEGSERNPRMPPWKGVLSTEDAQALVEYIKSFWKPEHFECQGPAHMNPGCGGMIDQESS